MQERLIKESCVFLDREARHGRYVEKWTPKLSGSADEFAPVKPAAATTAPAAPSPSIRNPDIICACCARKGHIVSRCPILKAHKAEFKAHLTCDGDHDWFFKPGNSDLSQALVIAEKW